MAREVRMAIRVSCPYCNTSFALPGAPPGGRAACPRCGDTFAVRPGDGVEEAAVPPPVAVAPPVVRSPRTGRLLVIAVGLALIGFAVGLGVTYFRTGPRPDPGPDTPPAAAVVPPADLAGLAYLPPESKLIVAVQSGPILAYAARVKQDPRELLSRAGLPDAAFVTLERAGLTLPQIDHVVVGLNPQDIRFTLVLSLRRPPDDEEPFLRGLQAKPDLQGKKDRYDVPFVGNAGLTLVRVSPRVWVFGFGERSLGGVDRGGYGPGAKHLSAELQELLGPKLPPDAAAWLAADIDRWATNPLLAAAGGTVPGLKAVLPVLAKGQAVVGGVSLGDPPRLRTFVRGVDADTGDKLRAYFARKATATDARTDGGGEWAMFDTPFDPREGLRPLREMLEDAAR